MATSEVPPSFDEPDSPLVSPWPVLVAGLATLAGAWLWSLVVPGAAPELRVLVVLAGVIALGAALALHLPHAGRAREERLTSGALLLLSAFAVAGGAMALPASWDSITLALEVLAVVGVGVAAVVAMPWRWAVASLTGLALVHFAGILTAVVCVAPAGGVPLWPTIQGNEPPQAQAPWLGLQLLTRFYGPYLQFTHLNNGYHFYAPEPGPVSQLWFRVEHADGQTHWVRLNDHDKARNGLEKRRWGALATNAAQGMPGPPMVPPPVMQRILAQEKASGKNRPFTTYWDVLLANRADSTIPPGEMPAMRSYQEPGTQAKLLISSVVRRVARTTPHPEGANEPVVAVKGYHIEFFAPPADAIAAGMDFRDPTLYQVFFLGDFDRNGELRADCFRLEHDENGNLMGRHQAPLLYWHLPIVRVPKDEAQVAPAPGGSTRRRQFGENMELRNYLRIHAGDKGETSNP